MAAMTGTKTVSTYEGQAPSEFEAVMLAGEHGAYPFSIVETQDSGSGSAGSTFIVSFAPMVEEAVRDLRAKEDVCAISARVHATIADACTDAAHRIRSVTGIDRVALSGGVFQNKYLARVLPEKLTALSFSVYTHSSLPPNDGCICLGQAAVAAHVLNDK
jgi:hydrogenase maturation protein HypF